jgi:hypothetical protein
MFNFIDLDEKTREYMLEAIDEAEQNNHIYFSPRFNDAGKQLWISLLKEAAREHNEHWLAYQLEANEAITGLEVAKKPLGGYSIRHVPHTAAATQAESQFNRFYILGLAKRARAEGIPYLQVYRAEERENPRPESEALVGRMLTVDEIEDELKETPSGFGDRLAQPNSGLSVRLP